MSGRHAARRCVRDDLWLLAHDEDYGFRPRIQTATLGVGLAGAVLVDLLLVGAIRIEAGHTCIRNPDYQQLLDDAIAERVVADLAMTGVWLPLREVIAGTAPGLYERTLIQLITTDVITAKARRFGRVRYRPADPNDLVKARYYPRNRVKMLGRGDPYPDPAADALCALIRALGLEHTLYLELPAHELQTRLGTITAHFTHTNPDPQLAAVPDLFAAVEAAIGDIAVAVYR